MVLMQSRCLKATFLFLVFHSADFEIEPFTIDEYCHQLYRDQYIGHLSRNRYPSDSAMCSDFDVVKGFIVALNNLRLGHVLDLAGWIETILPQVFLYSSIVQELHAANSHEDGIYNLLAIAHFTPCWTSLVSTESS